MNKKVTIKDVAEAAGVCKATVSYVLNDRKDQKISEATKKKVWQVVNMLGYRPNAFAQNMRVSNERLMIGVYLPTGLTFLEKTLCFDFLSDFLCVARENNANVVLLDGRPERISTADAIVAFSVTRDAFFALGECNFIPIVSVDCLIDDAIFFEVAFDYPALKQQAENFFGSEPFSYVCIPPRDEALRNAIAACFQNVVFVRRPEELTALNADNVLVTQAALKELLAPRKKNVFFPEKVCQKKIHVVADCVKLALSHEPCDRHAFKVL